MPSLCWAPIYSLPIPHHSFPSIFSGCTCNFFALSPASPDQAQSSRHATFNLVESAIANAFPGLLGFPSREKDQRKELSSRLQDDHVPPFSLFPFRRVAQLLSSSKHDHLEVPRASSPILDRQPTSDASLLNGPQSSARHARYFLVLTLRSATQRSHGPSTCLAIAVPFPKQLR